MAAAALSDLETHTDDAPLPSWLANHLNIEWNSDDVDALLTSIDASQSSSLPVLPHLPAELLLHILEYVPVDYILDWRLVCRGFRDAIDGRILYHHLQKTKLIGYLGQRTSANMMRLSDDAYERLHLVQAEFEFLEGLQSGSCQKRQPGPPWASTHAVFKIDPQWHRTYDLCNIGAGFPSRSRMLRQLTTYRAGQGFGTLVWAISLGTAVLDLDFPFAPDRHTFDMTVESDGTVHVEWKPMLSRFIKTETAFRRLMDKKLGSKITFSHTEDCLRAVRRQRLHAALDPKDKIDRHIKWSLRLLRPLWGSVQYHDPSTLDPVEADAVGVLLLLRRTAALSERQLEHLHQLAADYNCMVKTISDLSQFVENLDSQLLVSGQHTRYLSIPQRHFQIESVSSNPVAWSDELRTKIETRVQRWRAQRSLIEQMQTLMIMSQEALAVPEDAFDVAGSDF
ncbi:uncharacterized protein EKO05_0005573 [Ascochyta rabiei]|uniref:Uncharacterized protein n=1 Tax=Didymella rabiei TaxID=5454 RepID=A0A163KW64_DIDRA|nr:uncharacterized protein EKO05_0005573 [Ascochyta rabiei]KZM27294.1 hypothetical protein ST47_g1573 [Ascochyta rabiei]UPX15114.1 hypothetical protein EKO05_0005573 [Ascochyta rabiei]